MGFEFGVVFRHCFLEINKSHLPDLPIHKPKRFYPLTKVGERRRDEGNIN
jgi:hypothetical protein